MIFTNVPEMDIAAAHLAAANAVLDGALQERGTKKQFAQRLGWTNVWVSKFRNPQNIGDRPGLERVYDIAKALDISIQQQALLIEHLQLAYESEIRARLESFKLIDKVPINISVASLIDLMESATRSRDPHEAKIKYNQAFGIGNSLLQRIETKKNPVLFADLCMVLGQIAIRTNRPSILFYYSELARNILLKPTPFSIDNEKAEHLYLSSLHGQLNAYHHLRAYREAKLLYEKVENDSVFKKHQDIWKPHFYRDKIATYSKLPRMPLYQLIGIANDARRLSYYKTDISDRLNILFLERALASSLISRGKIKHADDVLKREVDFVDQHPEVGPLAATMLYRTYAQLLWEKSNGPSEEWAFFTRKALKIASDGGLSGQVQGIMSNFKIAITKILSDLNIQEINF